MTKVPVSRRAVHQRVQRHLLNTKKQLLVAGRGEASGTFYIVSESNKVLKSGLDLVTLANDLGLLKPWEEVES